jgi:hypothetical protein
VERRAWDHERVRKSVVAVPVAVVLAACASTSGPGKPGFHTEVKDGRLRVFREGSQDLEAFRKHGEPARQVTRIGGGPRGMPAVIDAYMAARCR